MLKHIHCFGECKGIENLKDLSYIEGIKIKVMNEERIIEQIIESNIDFHPIIKASSMPISDKLALQMLLETQFDNDINKMITDMLEFYIEMEEFEMAVIIRDDLQSKL